MDAVSRPIFSPSAMQRYRQKKASIESRLASGELTPDTARHELHTWTDSLMDTVESRTRERAPILVQCPTCNARQRLVGAVQRWRCSCSPTLEVPVATTRLEA